MGEKSPFLQMFSVCCARFQDDDPTVSTSESDAVELSPLPRMRNSQNANPSSACVRIGIKEPSLLSALKGTLCIEGALSAAHTMHRNERAKAASESCFGLLGRQRRAGLTWHAVADVGTE